MINAGAFDGVSCLLGLISREQVAYSERFIQKVRLVRESRGENGILRVNDKSKNKEKGMVEINNFFSFLIIHNLL